MDDNVSYTFDDEGNPVPAEKPPSARKPPAAPKKSRNKKRDTASPASGDGVLPNGATADTSLSSGQTTEEGEELLTDMFHIDGTGFDVTLSHRQEKIYWKAINPNGKQKTCRERDSNPYLVPTSATTYRLFLVLIVLFVFILLLFLAGLVFSFL